jgi:hypothetical protein
MNKKNIFLFALVSMQGCRLQSFGRRIAYCESRDEKRYARLAFAQALQPGSTSPKNNFQLLRPDF